jgi:hypothetical protein
MRGERVEGSRFTINHERGSIIRGTTKEIVRTVGYELEWWLYDPVATVVDPIYDVGSNTGGRRWKGPYHIPVINATLTQGMTVPNDRGFYNTDVLTVTVNMDISEGSHLSTSDSITIPELRSLPTNPDAFLRDRVVFKNEVFTPRQILPKGIITNDYTLFGIVLYQVNAEELVNDPQFAEYASYTPFGARDQYSFYENPEGHPGDV